MSKRLLELSRVHMTARMSAKINVWIVDEKNKTRACRPG